MRGVEEKCDCLLFLVVVSKKSESFDNAGGMLMLRKKRVVGERSRMQVTQTCLIHPHFHVQSAEPHFVIVRAAFQMTMGSVCHE